MKVWVPLPPSALGPNGRANWRTRVPIKQAYVHRITPLVNAAANGMALMERARVTYDWHSIQRTDADNAISRLKACLDVCQGRAFVNDRDVELAYRWHKAATKADEGVWVTIEEA